MVQVTVTKWDGTLAVRLPEEIIAAAHLQDGQRVELAAVDGSLRILQSTAEAEVASWFAGNSAAEWHAEYAASAAEIDWGPDVGREIIPE